MTSSLRYKLYSMTGKHNAENIFKFKNWGPPYYKFKKSFEGKESTLAQAAAVIEPPLKKNA